MMLYGQMGCEPTEEAMEAKREEYLAILQQRQEDDLVIDDFIRMETW